MELDFHQLRVRIQHFNIRVRDATVCCIHFGRFDETVISGNAIDISFGVSMTSSTDPMEMAITPLWVLATASLVVCPIDLVGLIRRLWISAGSGNCWGSLKKGCP